MVYGMKINLTWGYCNVNLAHIIEKTGKKHQEKISNAKQRKKYCIDFKPHCKKYDYYSMKNVCKEK